jgi:hypothetical protein
MLVLSGGQNDGDLIRRSLPIFERVDFGGNKIAREADGVAARQGVEI